MSNIKIIVAGNSHGINIPLTPMHETYFSDITHDKDNIDKYNPYFCELTGLYYGWKNIVKDEDIVGFEQRKRTFRLSENDIKEKLKSNDIIVHSSTFDSNCMYQVTLAERFMSNNGICCVCLKTQLFDILDVIHTHYPNMYNDAITILNNNWHYRHNMFITTGKIFNSYCEWLFDLLLNKCDLTKYTVVNRSIAHLAELLLFTLWVQSNHLITCNPPVYSYLDNGRITKNTLE